MDSPRTSGGNSSEGANDNESNKGNEGDEGKSEISRAVLKHRRYRDKFRTSVQDLKVRHCRVRY
jgi:hypothetical protein